MNSVISEELKKIEKEYNVEIIYAVESGSRAWGFASPDSDYDVRFIYKRNKDDYLKLEKRRDVIELPISDVLDINGWDLDKTLHLLYKSNPTLFEWLSSPIVYKNTPSAERLKEISKEYFLLKPSLYHYLSMARNNYREYLKGETVKTKKYFYALRPLLACRWILDKGTVAPILFSELVAEELPCELKADVDYLLDIKINNPELKLVPKIQSLNDYIEKSIKEISSKIVNLNDSQKDFDLLNKFFLNEITD
ncbi:MAG: nucleotidyltransferase domain-containing protein [Clostridiales bacterium]|nr:nucleotidyltransferase domain-containing protein [Clostridiales bacterium]